MDQESGVEFYDGKRLGEQLPNLKTHLPWLMKNLKFLTSP